jgi:hypothetical protein
MHTALDLFTSMNSALITHALNNMLWQKKVATACDTSTLESFFDLHGCRDQQ